MPVIKDKLLGGVCKNLDLLDLAVLYLKFLNIVY